MLASACCATTIAAMDARTPATAPGPYLRPHGHTQIDVYPRLSFEAAWAPEGAVCVARRASLISSISKDSGGHVRVSPGAWCTPLPKIYRGADLQLIAAGRATM